MENYTKFSENKTVNAADVTEEPVTQETVTDDEKEQKEQDSKTVFGYVDNCVRLNIRKRPNKEVGEVLMVVDVGTELLIIEPEKATGKWYKVEVDGLDGHGFCMKEFVTIE